MALKPLRRRQGYRALNSLARRSILPRVSTTSRVERGNSRNVVCLCNGGIVLCSTFCNHSFRCACCPCRARGKFTMYHVPTPTGRMSSPNVYVWTNSAHPYSIIARSACRRCAEWSSGRGRHIVDNSLHVMRRKFFDGVSVEKAYSSRLTPRATSIRTNFTELTRKVGPTQWKYFFTIDFSPDLFTFSIRQQGPQRRPKGYVITKFDG